MSAAGGAAGRGGGAAREGAAAGSGVGSQLRRAGVRGSAGRARAWSMYIRASMNVSSEQPAYFKILRAPPPRVRKGARAPTGQGQGRAHAVLQVRSYAMRVGQARIIIREQARPRVRVQRVPGRRAGAPPRARREAREMGSQGGGSGARCCVRAPILKIALHAYCRRLRRVKRRHLRRRQRQLPTHNAPRVKPWACLPQARFSPSGFRRCWSPGRFARPGQ